MGSRKFALVLLSTTVFGLLPCLPVVAVAEDLTINSDAIDKAIKNGKVIEATDNQTVNVEGNAVLKSDSLTIQATSSPNSVFKGTIQVQGNGTTPTLNTYMIGVFPEVYDAAGNLNWRIWTPSTVTGWTNLKNSDSGENMAAIMASKANLNLTDTVFANSVNNGTGSSNGENNFGGAVFVDAGATIKSELNIYYNNTTATAGGAVVVNSELENNTFTDDIFVGNKATKAGGAIEVFQKVKEIKRGIFGANSSQSGGAISVESGGSIGSINALFDENKATGAAGSDGGAIYNAGTIDSIFGSKFRDNQATDSGGAIFNKGTISSITGTLFSNNQATNGGAIYLDTNSSATISNSEFTGNTATYSNTADTGGGGAIGVYTNANLTTNGNTFEGNKVEGATSVAGGAVHNDNGTWASTNDTFTGNTSSTDGGAIGANGNTTLTNAQIIGNKATDRGGGIFARNSNGPAQTNIINGKISNNTAATGGGLANVNLGSEYVNTSNVTISGTEISGNTATGNGGGIYNAGNLTIQGSGVTIKANNATIGQNLYNDESGIVNIENADDQIDLNYVPYPDSTTQRPSGELHTLFDQSQDIYNAGTMNINNSNLQLHQGINTSAALTSDAQRKVGTVNITNSTVDLGGSDVPGAGVMYGDTVTISDNSTIKTHVKKKVDGTHGKISANNININGNNTLDVVLSSGTLKKGSSKEYQILEGNVTNQFSNLPGHKNYQVEAVKDKEIGWYKITREGENACPGCDENEVSTNDGWLDGDDITQNDEAYDIQQKLFNTEEGQIEALDGLAPDVSPLVQAHATEITQRLASIVSDRFYESMDRTGYIHRGKRFYRFPRHNSNLWIQGLYGKSKYDVRKGWDMDNRGISVGFDGHVNEAVRLGIAYAYTNSSGESVQRDTDIKSHTGMIYGNYNPNRFYANWLAMYTRSKYDEDKKVFNHRVKANYNVDAFGAQFMLGRKMGPYVNDDWATGVIKPEIGARYIYTKQHSYTDTVGQSVGSADGSTLTGILGVQYTIGYALSPTLSWYPELRAALTYDFMEPDTKMRVNLLNGSVYEVKTENMDRFGIEVGARIGLDINRKAEVALEYEGLFKGDYTNHTGLANLKYKF